MNDRVFASMFDTTKKEFWFDRREMLLRDVLLFFSRCSFLLQWCSTESYQSSVLIDFILSDIATERQESDDVTCCFSFPIARRWQLLTIMCYLDGNWRVVLVKEKKSFRRGKKKKTGEDEISPVICSVQSYQTRHRDSKTKILHLCSGKLMIGHDYHIAILIYSSTPIYVP